MVQGQGIQGKAFPWPRAQGQTDSCQTDLGVDRCRTDKILITRTHMDRSHINGHRTDRTRMDKT